MLQIQSHHFSANRKGKSGNMDRFYFLGLRNHCRRGQQPWNSEILAPWKESYDKSIQHIKKQRHHFAKKVLYSQSYDLPSSHVWMWVLYHKNAESQRIDVSELWCWRRLLRVPWTSRRSNQSILKETNAECSLEGLMLMLKRPYFGHLMERAHMLKERLRAGGKGGDRGWDGWMASPTQWIWVWASSGK